MTTTQLKELGFKESEFSDSGWTFEQSGVKIVYLYSFKFLSKDQHDIYRPIHLQRSIDTWNEAVLLFNLLTGDVIQPTNRYLQLH